MRKNIQFINPDQLPRNPALSHAVITHKNGKTVYIGGQNSVNSSGEIIGKGDIGQQTDQILKNIQSILEVSGATLDNLVKLTIYIVQGQDPHRGFVASQKYLGKLKNPPAITGLFVSALVHPDFLVEIDSIAFIPD